MKKFGCLLLLVPLIGLFSCGKTEEKYTVKKEVDMHEGFPRF